MPEGIVPFDTTDMTKIQLAALILEMMAPDTRHTSACPHARLSARYADVLQNKATPEERPIMAAIVSKESSFRTRIVGLLKEVGPAQINLRPTADAAWLCKDLNVLKFADNIECGLRIMRNARRVCGGHPEHWLGRYRGEKCGPSDYAAAVLARIPKKPVLAGK